MIEPTHDDEAQQPADRDSAGRFAPGNQAARGHGRPLAHEVQELRRCMLEAASPEDMAAVVRRLIEDAKAGSVPAAKLLMDRIWPARAGVDLEPASEGTQVIELEFDAID